MDHLNGKLVITADSDVKITKILDYIVHFEVSGLKFFIKEDNSDGGEDIMLFHRIPNGNGGYTNEYVNYSYGALPKLKSHSSQPNNHPEVRIKLIKLLERHELFHTHYREAFKLKRELIEIRLKKIKELEEELAILYKY